MRRNNLADNPQIQPTIKPYVLPNNDRVFHNVFSFTNGKPFDLGLYPTGASKRITLDRAAVNRLYCNIHPHMAAYIVAVDTPYYGISDRTGHVSITNVPDGKYEMHVWYERSLPEDLKNLARAVTITSTSRELGTIQVPENPSFTPAHKNKYGQDYAPPPTNNSYSHP